MRLADRIRAFLPRPRNAALALFSAALLVAAFPDFEFAALAWFGLVPLFLAAHGESDRPAAAFGAGWIFGTAFFFGTCWWLTFAPITYAHLPWPPVYLAMLGAAATVGLFPAVFALAASVLFRRFGTAALATLPFVWTGAEFARMALTGNNWNALGYSQAFAGPGFRDLAEFGGVLLVGFACAAFNAAFALPLVAGSRRAFAAVPAAALALVGVGYLARGPVAYRNPSVPSASVVALQPNVPMDGLTLEEYEALLDRHFALADDALRKLPPGDVPRVVVFPESPMMFQYGKDAGLRERFRGFATRNRTALLFNSAEWTRDGERILNSAVMVDAGGDKIAQYDKIFLLPFGEFIPFPEPIAGWMPAFVGNFERGDEYDLLQFGDARAGVMICFESHFGAMSAEYVRRGADFLVEMTNDGYLGRTPVLRQHLANAVFRAIETRRPVVRVTNVGITAYIDENGQISGVADVYSEASRIWPVFRSDRGSTLYTRWGEWFGWLCSIAVLALLSIVYFSRRKQPKQVADESAAT